MTPVCEKNENIFRRAEYALARFSSAFSKFRSNGKARKFCDFCYSPLFVYAVGLMTLVLNLVGIDEITYTFLALTGAATLVLCPDILPTLAVMIFFTVARSAGNRDFDKFNAVSYAVLAVDGCIAGLGCIFHLTVNFSAKNVRGSRLLLGFALLGAGLITNGFFSKEYVFSDIASALKLIAYIFGVYFVVRAYVRPTSDTLRYFSFICLIYGLVVSAQLMGMYFFNKEFIDSGFDKDKLIMGWGISNTIGEALFRGMPFCFYLMCTEEKHNWYYFAAACIILVSQPFTYARASLLFTVPIFVVCYILCCIFGKRRRQTLICGAVALLGAVAAVIVFRRQLMSVFSFFLKVGLSDRGRISLWCEGVDYFFRNPIFGVGLRHRYGMLFHHFTYYHNTLVQFLTAGGAVGILTYICHRGQTSALFTQKLTLKRAFLGALAGGILLISLLDNFYMYLATQLFFGTALAFAEHDLNVALPFAYRYKIVKGRYKKLY